MAENFHGYVYKITCKVNGKIYIGITTRTPEHRWKQHVSTAYQKKSKDYKCVFKNAIRKYGKENFLLETQEEIFSNIEDLKKREIYWIKFYNSYAFDENSNGYNMTRGGDFADERQQRAIYKCDIVKGTIIKKFNSILSAQEELGIRICSVSQYNMTAGGYGYFYIEDFEGLSKEEIKDKIHNNYPNLVYKLSKEGKVLGIYRNVSEAAKENNIPNTGNIISCCLGSRRYVRNFQWCYQKDLQKRLNKEARPQKTNAKPIIQYSLDGKEIKKWDSITQACEALGALDSHISQCCKKKRQSSCGFQWRYADDKDKQLKVLYSKRPIRCKETGQEFETINHAVKYFHYGHDTIKKSCMGNKILKPYSFEWI